MLIRLLAAPLRLCLGLPALYGMTLTNRVLQIARWLGIYKGPIGFVMTAKPINFFAKPRDI